MYSGIFCSDYFQLMLLTTKFSASLWLCLFHIISALLLNDSAAFPQRNSMRLPLQTVFHQPELSFFLLFFFCLKISRACKIFRARFWFCHVRAPETRRLFVLSTLTWTRFCPSHLFRWPNALPFTVARASRSLAVFPIHCFSSTLTANVAVRHYSFLLVVG